MTERFVVCHAPLPDCYSIDWATDGGCRSTRADARSRVACGVWTTTVSHVLNDLPGKRIRPETGSGYAMPRLISGYVPNGIAWSLRTQRIHPGAPGAVSAATGGILLLDCLRPDGLHRCRGRRVGPDRTSCPSRRTPPCQLTATGTGCHVDHLSPIIPDRNSECRVPPNSRARPARLVVTIHPPSPDARSVITNRSRL